MKDNKLKCKQIEIPPKRWVEMIELSQESDYFRNLKKEFWTRNPRKRKKIENIQY